MRFRYVAPIIAVVVTLGLAAALLDTKFEDGLTVWASPTLGRACVDFAAALYDISLPKSVWLSVLRTCSYRIPEFLDGLRTLPIFLIAAVIVVGTTFILGWSAIVAVGASVTIPASAAKHLYRWFRRHQ